MIEHVDSRLLEIEHLMEGGSPARVKRGSVVRVYPKANVVKVRIEQSNSVTTCECAPGGRFATGDHVLVLFANRQLPRPFVMAYRGQAPSSGGAGAVLWGGGGGEGGERHPYRPTNVRTETSPIAAAFMWRPVDVHYPHWYVVQRAKDSDGTDSEVYVITQGSIVLNLDPAFTHYRVAGCVLDGSGLVRSEYSSWTAGAIEMGATGQVLTSDGETFEWLSPGALSFYLNDLLDVDAGSPGDEEVLAWDEDAGAWRPVALPDIPSEMEAEIDHVTHWLLYTMVGRDLISNTTEATRVWGGGRGSRTLEPSMLELGTQVKAFACGMLYMIGTPELTISLHLGDEELMSAGPSPVRSGELGHSIGFPWVLDINLTCIKTGEEGQVVAAGNFAYDNIEGAEDPHWIIRGTPVTTNTTIPLQVEIKMNWNVADEYNGFMTEQGRLELFKSKYLSVAAPSLLRAILK